MRPPDQRRVRLSIDIEPDLRRRIKIAAAERDLSVRDYIEAILRQAIAAGNASTTESARMTGTRLSAEEQQRGLRALAALERARDELSAKQGTLSPEAWELLNASRDERTDELLRSVEE